MKKSVFLIILVIILAAVTAFFFMLSGKNNQDSRPSSPGTGTESAPATKTGDNPQNTAKAPAFPTIPDEKEYLAMNISLTFGDDAKTTENICWQTFSDFTDGVLQYAKVQKDTESNEKLFSDTKNYIEEQSEAEFINLYFSEKDTKKSNLIEKDGLVHRVWLTGLEQGSSYAFRVGDKKANKWSEIRTFTTISDKKEYSFLYFTDMQGFVQKDYNVWATVADAAMKNFPEVDFIVNTGDPVEENSNQTQWRMFFESPSSFGDKTSVTAAGNHDKKSAMQHFTFGSQSDRNAQTGGYYSLDIGSVHFTVIYTGDNDKDLSGSQLKWLKKDLASVKSGMAKIVLLHKSPVTVANNYENTDILALRKQLLPVFDEYGADIAISGHDHYYFVSEPMTAKGKGDFRLTDSTRKILSYTCDVPVFSANSENKGTVYFINGSSGCRQYDGQIKNIDGIFTRKAEILNNPTFSYCEYDASQIIFYTFCVEENGNISLLDSWGYSFG